VPKTANARFLPRSWNFDGLPRLYSDDGVTDECSPLKGRQMKPSPFDIANPVRGVLSRPWCHQTIRLLTLQSKYLAGALVLAIGLPQISTADTIVYSSFLSGTTYVCCAGYPVTGPAASNVGVLVGQSQTAGAFTPSGNFILTQIDVAFWFANGPNTNGFTLSLNQDSGGVPGTAVATWTGLAAPSQFAGPSSLVLSVFPAAMVLLISGNQYWIVASPSAANTYAAWAINALDGTGVGGILAGNTGAGWVVQDIPFDTLGFDVRGTVVPEPGALSCIAAGLLVLVAARRKTNGGGNPPTG